MIRLCLLLTLLCAWANTRAQSLSGISTRWSDSFVEWELFVFASDSTSTEEETDPNEPPEEELFGEVKLRWLNMRDDWSEWDYTMGEERGTIKMKWKDDPTQWELRNFQGDIITMRASWNNDLSEWRVTNNSITLQWKSRWSNQADEWLVQDNNQGVFYMYTLTEGDPRDWAIEDKLEESVPAAMKIALVFLTIYHSSPRQ